MNTIAISNVSVPVLRLTDKDICGLKILSEDGPVILVLVCTTLGGIGLYGARADCEDVKTYLDVLKARGLSKQWHVITALDGEVLAAWRCRDEVRRLRLSAVLRARMWIRRSVLRMRIFYEEVVNAVHHDTAN